MIPGVSHDSECSPAFDAKAKLAFFSAKPERITANDQMASQIRDQGSFWAISLRENSTLRVPVSWSSGLQARICFFRTWIEGICHHTQEAREDLRLTNTTGPRTALNHRSCLLQQPPAVKPCGSDHLLECS